MKLRRLTLISLFFVTAAAYGQAQPPSTAADLALAHRLGIREAVVHDPSTLIKCNGEYWIYYTGNLTPSFHSKDLITWTRGPQVFAGPPDWVRQAVPQNRGGNFWAPDVAKVGDRYMLFYSASSFGKNTSAIGVTTNPTLDPTDPQYKWTDGGEVVQSVEKDDFNCIDPAVLADKDGRVWLSFGSFWSGIKLIELDPATGRRIAPDAPMYSLAHWDSIEASYIYHHDRYYYLFVSFGLCCRGANSTYHTLVGRCEKVTGPYLDKNGKDMLLGGGTTVTDSDGPLVGPGHAGILEENGRFWFSCHFEYDGVNKNGSKLSIRPLTWSDDGWPVIGTIDDSKKQ